MMNNFNPFLGSFPPFKVPPFGSFNHFAPPYNKYYNLKKEPNYNNTYNNSINKETSLNSDKKKCNDSSDDDIFEIFGLKLHSDDLLLIGLLFFLYQEDVKDTYLYIALILLLLS